ncbi:hypothetical protein V1478_003499 [Vespula squamosa]|uniref:Uncharacterized protein n=1 Tax=Vespula squamosa TaxID=30214 RepID=A0ABD2BM02_VESSQ
MPFSFNSQRRECKRDQENLRYSRNTSNRILPKIFKLFQEGGLWSDLKGGTYIDLLLKRNSASILARVEYIVEVIKGRKDQIKRLALTSPFSRENLNEIVECLIFKRSFNFQKPFFSAKFSTRFKVVKNNKGAKEDGCWFIFEDTVTLARQRKRMDVVKGSN